ncbi:MAG: hypothetical protein ACTS5F_01495 [Candidatus Hodgkinia cicadicola]
MHKLFNLRPFRKFTELLFRLINQVLSKFNINASASNERLTTTNLSILQNISLAASAVTIWLYITFDTLFCVITETFGLTFEDPNELAEALDEC